MRPKQPYWLRFSRRQLPTIGLETSLLHQLRLSNLSLSTATSRTPQLSSLTTSPLPFSTIVRSSQFQYRTKISQQEAHLISTTKCCLHFQLWRNQTPPPWPSKKLQTTRLLNPTKTPTEGSAAEDKCTRTILKVGQAMSHMDQYLARHRIQECKCRLEAKATWNRSNITLRGWGSNTSRGQGATIATARFKVSKL